MAEVEEGRRPLTGEDEATSSASARVSRWKNSTRLLAVADLGVTAGLILWPFGFDPSKCWKNQVGSWSFGSSLVDWVALAFVRDVFVLWLLLGRNRKEEENVRSSRRLAVIVLFYGVGRMTLVDWQTARAESVLLPTVLWAGIASSLLALGCQLLLSALWALEEAQALLRNAEIALASINGSAEGAKGSASADDGSSQYSGKLSFWQTLGVLKPYFWPSTGEPRQVMMNRTRAILTWVCVAGSKVCGLVSPIFLAQATNNIQSALGEETLGEQLTSKVVVPLVLYSLSTFMSKALKELQSLVYIKVQQAAYIEIADKTFAHLHSLSLEWHLKKKMGNVIRSMDRGIQAAQSTMQYVFLYLFPTLCEAAAVTFIFIFHFQNARLAVFVFLNLFLYCYLTVKITLWRKQFRTETTKSDNQLHDRLTDSLVNYETVKYFTAEEYERREYRSVVQRFQAYSMATQASLSLLNVVQQLIINFTLAGGMIIAAARVLQEDGKIGDFVAVNAYILQVFTPLSFLGTIYNMVVNAIIDMASFGQLLAESSEVFDQPHARELDMAPRAGVPMIEFQQVSFAYRRQAQGASIKDISFTVPAKSTVALVGSTGAGKTTVTRLLFRFYDVLAGQVLVNGQDVRDVTQKSLRKAIGMVPQDVVLFNSTIAHNIRYGNIDAATQDDIQKAAEKAQLAEFITHQPDGYETVVGERGLKLSGGEKQRLAIARCLVKDPPIVVLDEATSALDSETETAIQKALDILNSSRTVVAIAHRLGTIRHFDQILVLNKGEVVERGTHSSLLAKESSRYASMWNRQAAGMMDDELPNGASSPAQGTGQGLELPVH